MKLALLKSQLKLKKQESKIKTQVLHHKEERMRSHTLSLGIFLFSGILLTSLPATLHAQIELKEGMTQGDFALWLVNAVGAMSKLPPAATSEDAINFLTQLGTVPEEGWQKNELLTNEVLASLLEDPEEGANLSFEELVDKVRARIQNIFEERRLGTFRVLAPTPSQPAV